MGVGRALVLAQLAAMQQKIEKLSQDRN